MGVILTEGDGKEFVQQQELSVEADINQITKKTDIKFKNNEKELSVEYKLDEKIYKIPRWIPEAIHEGDNWDKITYLTGYGTPEKIGVYDSRIFVDVTDRNNPVLRCIPNEGWDKELGLGDRQIRKKSLNLSKSNIGDLKIRTSNGQTFSLELVRLDEDKKNTTTVDDGDNGLTSQGKKYIGALHVGNEDASYVACSTCKVNCNLGCSRDSINEAQNICGTYRICTDSCLGNCNTTCSSGSTSSSTDKIIIERLKLGLSGSTLLDIGGLGKKFTIFKFKIGCDGFTPTLAFKLFSFED